LESESAAEDDSTGDSIDRMVRIETLLFWYYYLNLLPLTRFHNPPEKLEIEDIDSLDKKDPLCVVEYIDDLYTYYKAAEVTIFQTRHVVSET